MAAKNRSSRSSPAARANEYMRGVKGRKDDVRGSRIYPASDPNAPPDAVLMDESDLVKHRGPKQKPFKRAA